MNEVIEQEPVAWRMRIPHSILVGRMGFWELYEEEPDRPGPQNEVEALYTHPFIVSEESLEMLKAILTIVDGVNHTGYFNEYLKENELGLALLKIRDIVHAAFAPQKDK